MVYENNDILFRSKVWLGIVFAYKLQRLLDNAYTVMENHRRNTSETPAKQELPPVFGKKELCQFLGLKYSKALRSYFFDDERLKRIGVDLFQYKKIRLFTADQCAKIKTELCTIL